MVLMWCKRPNMKAYGKNILVKPFPPPEFSDGGLIVPDTVKKPSNKVRVISIGGNVTRVKEGQTGWRVKDWGVDVLVDGELHFIMNEAAILSTI